MNSIVCKSIFNIQLQNKKNILVGYLVENVLSVVIIFECNISKNILILNQKQWNMLMDDATFNLIFTYISVNHTKKIKLDDNFFYKINAKCESAVLQLYDKRITLTRSNLLYIRQLYSCINAHIIEKINNLYKYSSWYDIVLSIIKNELQYLPPDCLRTDFISSYILDYNFNFDNITDENKSFILELHKVHSNKLSDIVLNDIVNKEN